MSTQVRDKVSRHDAFITEQLHRAEQRIRLIDLGTSLGGWVAGTLAYAVLLMLLDRAFVLSAATRQTLFLTYGAASLAYLYTFVVRPLRWRVNRHFAARQLEQTLPGSRNHVINWIDLHDEKVPGTIRSALGQRAAKDLANTDVDEAISSRRAVAVATVAGTLLGVLIALFVIFGPGPFRSLFGRAFAPFGGASASIATRTQVSVVRPEGGDAVVTIGSPVTIVAEVTGRRPGAHDKDAPSLLYRHDENEPFRRRFLQPDAGDQWVTTVAPLDVGNGFIYKVTAGDGETPEYRVSTRPAPLIADFLATYHYRPYVQKAARSRTTRKLEDMRGTEVQILARTTRKLKDGRLDFDGDDGQGELIRAEIRPDDPQALRFRLVLDRPGKYRIRFTSTEGESYLDQVGYDVKVLPDHPPTVQLTQPGKDVEAPVNGHVELAGEAADDIGIASMKLNIQHVGGGALRPKPYLADKLGKAEIGTPRRVEYRDLLEIGSLKDEQGKPFEARPGTQLEYWLEAADACDYPKPNVGVSKKFKVTITAAKDPQQQKKEQQAAQQRQEQQEKQQGEQLKNEKKERDQQRQQEEQQEKNEANQRDQERKNAGQDGGKQEEKKGVEKGNDPKEDKGKEGEPKGEKGQGKDDQTRKQAEDLKKAMGKREKEQGKGEKDKGQQERQDQAENKPGEARGADDKKPGESKETGDKQPDDKPGEGKDKGKEEAKPGAKKEDGAKADTADQGQGRDAGKPDPKDDKGEGKGPAKADQPKPGEGKEGDKPKLGEGKSAGKPEEARNAGEKKPDGEGKPGEKPRQGEAKESKTANNPSAGERPAEKKDGAKDGGENKGEGKPGEKSDARPMNPDGKPGEAKDASKGEKPGEPKDAKGGTDGAQDDGSGDKPGERKGGAGKPDPKDATKGDVEAKAKEVRDASGADREQAKRDLQQMAEKANDPAAREAAKQALQEAEKGELGGKEPGEGEGQAAGQKGPDGKGDKQDKGKPTGQGKAEDGKGEKPGEGMKGDRREPGKSDEGDGLAARPEKAERHRASMMQLEEFRKKVDPDLLKDARMSAEQFRQFLQDYADLARREPPAADDRDVPPAPGRSGPLPSLPGRTIKPGGKAPADDLRGEGRPKPPPEYRDSHADFLQRLQRPSK
ncbi:MAG: DUF4175 family protein [Gemmataceae bacterium]